MIEYNVLLKQKKSILRQSLSYYEELIEEFPESKLVFKAMNNAALISLQLDYKEDAIDYYKEILKSKANDKEKGGVGEGLMAEPYALYKNRACINLAEIYLTKKDYTNALKYINLTKKHPYQHFCGNAHAANEVYLATFRAKCYLGLNHVTKALEYALPYSFNTILADNSEALALTLEILKSNYSLNELNIELEKSLKHIKIKKVKGYERGITTFMGIKFNLPFYIPTVIDFDALAKLSEIDQFTLAYKESEFYQEIVKQ